MVDRTPMAALNPLVPEVPKEQKPAMASVANAKDSTPGRRRIPMSTAERKMEVPAIDGYYLYWFKESNVSRAIQAGYEFVNPDEVQMHSFSIAGMKDNNGSTDLGSRVSIVGDSDTNVRAYLMKLKQEFRDEDQAAIDARNASIMGAIFKDELIATQNGGAREKGQSEYVKKALFQRPVRKAKIVR